MTTQREQVERGPLYNGYTSSVFIVAAVSTTVGAVSVGLTMPVVARSTAHLAQFGAGIDAESGQRYTCLGLRCTACFPCQRIACRAASGRPQFGEGARPETGKDAGVGAASYSCCSWFVPSGGSGTTWLGLVVGSCSQRLRDSSH